MNAQEAIAVCRYVRAACPQQAMDEFTPQAWADLLTDVRYEDAQEAVRVLVKQQPFVAPAEIITEIKRIGSKRTQKYGTADIPEDMPKPRVDASIEEERVAMRAESRYLSCIYRLVAEGLLTRADPQPSYTDLKPLLDAQAEENERAAIAASQQRQEKLASKIGQVAAKLQLSR